MVVAFSMEGDQNGLIVDHPQCCEHSPTNTSWKEVGQMMSPMAKSNFCALLGEFPRLELATHKLESSSSLVLA